MKTRTRALAALLALFTLSATVAGEGWAAGCDRMGGDSTAAHAGHAAASTIHDGSDAADPSPLPNPPCPMGAPVGCAPVFVPAPLVVASLGSPREALVTVAPDTNVDLLPIPPPLRPPS